MRFACLLTSFVSIFYGNIAFSSSSSFEEADDVISVCIAEAQKYIDFEMDYLESCQKSMPQNSNYQYNINDIWGHIEKIHKTKKLFQDVQNKRESFDSVLYTLLNKRLFDIKCEDEERKYRPSMILDLERKQNKEAAKATFFQFTNLMIKLLFQSTTPDQLSVKTREQIRLSPSLWSLLKDETDDLGHPDQTEMDLDAFNIYVDPSERMMITYYGLGQKNFTRVKKVTPYERSQYDEKYKKKIPDLPYPDWLNPFKALKNAELAKNEVSAKSSHDDEIIIISNHDDIVIPNKNDELREVIDASSSNLSDEKLLSDKKQLEKKREEIKSSQEKSILITDPYQGDKEKEVVQTKNHEKNKKSQKKSVAPKESVGDIWAPRGMRIFHPQQGKVTFQTQVSPNDLRGKHQRILKSIFDSKGFTTVSYGKFKSLWKAINGDDSVKEDTKTSHKVLLDQNGKKVSGIFAHGDAMCYTKRTIPYIRYALQLVGFGL